MGNLELRRRDLLGSVEEQVEVDRPRAARRDDRAIAAQGALDREQLREKLTRLETGLELDGAVQEVRLVLQSDRRRFAQLRDADDARLRQTPKRIDRAGKGRFSVAEVG